MCGAKSLPKSQVVISDKFADDNSYIFSPQ